jgi:hypothetical protein
VSRGRKARGVSNLAQRRLAREPLGAFERRVISDDSARSVGVMRPCLPAGERWRTECFTNNRYSVQISDAVTPWGLVTHLWIRRHDASTVHAWADLQRIKDEVVGSERVAVQVFPARDKLVDAADMYHLWVLPRDMVLPFGLEGAP